MGVQLVTYNPTAAVFGRWRLSLDWQPDGSILGTHQLQHKIVQGVLEIEGEEADALRHATYGKGRRQPLHRHTQWSYASRLTPGWLLYEVAQCGVQVAAVAVYFVYVTRVVDSDMFSTSFPAYDSQAAAPARYFLPARLTTATALASAAGVSAPVPLAGAAGRWALPPDMAGLQQAAAMFQRAQQMADLYVWYGVLQGVALLMLLVFAIKYISFQPRLALIFKTLAAMAQDLMHFLAVYLVMTVCLVLCLVVVFGPRVSTLSSLGDALLNMLQANLLHDFIGMRTYQVR
ncbi:PKD_channel domain-containing protein, partial [Haematococcus lacustris]